MGQAQSKLLGRLAQFRLQSTVAADYDSPAVYGMESLMSDPNRTVAPDGDKVRRLLAVACDGIRGFEAELNHSRAEAGGSATPWPPSIPHAAGPSCNATTGCAISCCRPEAAPIPSCAGRPAGRSNPSWRGQAI